MSRHIRRLRKIGRIWAIVEGKIVVKGEFLPRLGDQVYTSEMEVAGTISGILGPVNNYFIEISPAKRLEFKVGDPLYILEEGIEVKKHIS